MGAWVIGIDLGSARTTAAIAEPRTAGGPVDVRTLEVAGRLSTPTIAAVDTDGRLVAGPAAELVARTHPDRAEPGVVGLLGHPAPVLLTGAAVDARNAVAQIIRLVVDEGRLRAGGTDPDAAVVTHPARWAGVRCAALVEAASRAGLRSIVTVPEPVAAAANLAGSLTPGDLVAVFDLGASTLDTTVLRRTGDDPADTGAEASASFGFEVVGVPGIDDTVGGDRFDHVLLGWALAQLGAIDPDTCADTATRDDADARAAALALRAEVQRAKEALSSYTSTTITVSAPVAGVHEDAVVELVLNRSQFEALVIDDVERAVASLTRTVEAAGVSVDGLAAVLLAGGSARLPLVAQLIAEQVGSDRIVLGDDPASVVALGAARSAARWWHVDGGRTDRRDDSSVAATDGAPGAAPAPPLPAPSPLAAPVSPFSSPTLASPTLASPAGANPTGSGRPGPSHPAGRIASLPPPVHAPSAPVVRALPPPLQTPGTAPASPAAVVPHAHVAWRVPVPAAIGRLAADATGVVLGDRDGGVRAIDGATGRLRWHVPVNAAVWAAPGLGGDLVVVGGVDGRVGALDRSTGAARWWASTGAPIGAAPVIAAHVVIVADDAGVVTGLDRVTGAIRWRLPLRAAIRADVVPLAPGSMGTAAAVVPTEVIVATLGGEVFAIDTSTGACRWGYRTAGPVAAAPAVVGGTVLVPSEAGIVYGLDATTGQARYGIRCAGSRVSSVAASDTLVAVADPERLRVHRADTGQAVVEIALAEVAATGAAPTGVVLTPAASPAAAVVETGGVLVGVSLEGGGTRFVLPTGAGNTTAPVRTGGLVVAGTSIGQLYAIVT